MIDFDRLRRDLTDYYGTAAFSGFPAAIIDVGKVQRASDEELISISKQLRFDSSKYEK